jgi:dynein heavy chain, axonemal
MYEYWNKLHFVLRNSPDENIVFIDEDFLDAHLALIEQHLTKTVILKNSPFSKALVVLLSDWENWLLNGRKMLSGFLAAQRKFIEVRAIFRMDEINKLLPIESTEYDSIENIWKSVVKKILDHPRVS